MELSPVTVTVTAVTVIVMGKNRHGPGKRVSLLPQHHKCDG